MSTSNQELFANVNREKKWRLLPSQNEKKNNYGILKEANTKKDISI